MGNTPYFGVYSDYESDEHGFYTVTVGLPQENTKESLTITPGNYLVFRGRGPMPAIVIDIWQQIWRYFSAETEYQRLFITDFEAYTSPEQVAIYIGIK